MAVQKKAGTFSLPSPFTWGGKFGSTGSGTTQFSGPRGITSDSSGNLFIADYGNNRVVKYTSAHAYAAHLAQTGVTGVSIDWNDETKLYTSCLTKTLRKINSNLGGTVHASYTPSVDYGSVSYGRIQVGNGMVYVIDNGNDTIWQFSTSTFPSLLTPSQVVAPGTAAASFFIGYDRLNDDLSAPYAIDSVIGRYDTYLSGGNRLLVPKTPFLVATGYAAGDLAVDPNSGVTYVIDTTNKKVRVYLNSNCNPSEQIGEFGSSGTGDGQFTTPDSIHVTSTGRVYVSDIGSNRIQYWDVDWSASHTGVGFSPKAMFLFTADSVGTSDLRQQFSLLGKDSDGVDQHVGLFFRRKGGVASGTANTTDMSLTEDVSVNGRTMYGDYSLDADGFTLELAPGDYESGHKIGYMALGGPDVSALLVKQYSAFDHTSAVGSTLVVPTTGITPRGGVILASANDSLSHETASIGMFGYDGSGVIKNNATSFTATTTDNADSFMSSISSIVISDSAGTSVLFRATVTAVASGSMTITVAVNNLPIDALVHLAILAFSGSEIEAGTFNTNSASAGTVMTIPTEVPPVASLLISDRVVGFTGTSAHNARWNITGSTLGGDDVTLYGSMVDGGPSTNVSSTFAGVSDTAIQPVAGVSGNALTYTFPAAGSFNERYAYLSFDIAVTNLSGDVDVVSGGDTTPLRFNHTDKLSASALVDLATNSAPLKTDVNLQTATPPRVELLAGNVILTGAHALYGAAHLAVGPDIQYAYLQEDHNLTGSADVELGNPDQPAWLGNNVNIGTHVLAAEASIEIGGDNVPLSMDYTGKLSALDDGSALSVDVTQTWPPQDHPLTGGGTIELFVNSAFLARDPGPLEAIRDEAIGVVTSGRLRTGSHLRVVDSQISVDTDTLGLTGAPLPQPKQLGPDDIIGTVNLFKNPSFEFDANTSSWASMGSGVTSFDTAKPWDGQRSLGVAMANSANSGVRLYSQRGLGLTGVGHVFLNQFQIRRNSSITGGLTILADIFYTDGTSSGITVESGFTPGTDWTQILCPALLVTPTKMVDYVRLSIYRTGAAAGQSFSIDGVQIEEDRGKGHTPFATGSYGLPYHRWWGTVGDSITIRDAIPATVGGHNKVDYYKIETEVWKCNANGTRIEEITQYCYNIEITIDPERDISRTLSMEITGSGWAKLEPFVDWVQPWFRVTRPDGTVEEGPKGLFVVWPSEITEQPWGRVVNMTGYSAEAMLKTQGVRGHMFIKEGKLLRRAVQVILKSSHLGEDWRGRDMYDLPRDPGRNETAHKDMTWDKKEIVLTILNDLAKKLGWHPFFATNYGYLTSRIRKGGDKRLSKQTPVKVYAAEVEGVTGEFTKWIGLDSYSGNEVVGVVKTSPQMEKWDENKFIVISVDPKKKGIKAVRRINDEDNPASSRRRRSKAKVIEMDVRDQADAEALAEAIAEEINSNMEQVTISVVPSPSVDFTRRVVYLALYNQRKEPIAVGLYKVIQEVVGAAYDEAMTTLTLGYVRDLKDISATDPTGWDLDDNSLWDWEAVAV